ncbi:hypothetical protein Tco_1495480, partial [Tanacetum coccineum]
EFSMEGIESLNDVSQDKEVKPDAKLSGGVRRAARANLRTSHGLLQEVLQLPRQCT